MSNSRIAARHPEIANGGLARVAEMLGGRRVWRHVPSTKIELHDAVLKGIPRSALVYLFDRPWTLPRDQLARAVGISLRTAQRYRTTPRKALNVDQGARLWKLAEIVEAATELQGSREAAEKWLNMPAPALNRRTPITMMATPVGTELVEQLLTRLKYGVYT